MASLEIGSAFQTLLDEFNVSNKFQEFLRSATLTSQQRFLAAIPVSIDADLITEFRNNGGRPDIGELVNIRMAFIMCKDAESDAKAVRAAVRASPDIAAIPDNDKRVLKELFFRRHGWYLSDKKVT